MQTTCPVLDRTLFGYKLFSTAQALAKSASTKTSALLNLSNLWNIPQFEVAAKHLPILITAFHGTTLDACYNGSLMNCHC